MTVMCKTCKVPFEEGAKFCATCGGYVDYVGVTEGGPAAPSGGAPDGLPTAPTVAVQTPESEQARVDAERRAIAEAEQKEQEAEEARGRAAAAGAAEQQARAGAQDQEARAQAEAKAKAEAEAAAAAAAAESARRAAAMIARPSAPAGPGPSRPSGPPPPPPLAPGAPQAQHAAARPAEQVDESGELTCAQCGMGNPAGRTFCRRCGAKLGGPVAATAQIPVARGPGLLASPGVRQLLGALVLAAVAFAIIFPLRNAEHSAYNAILDIFR